MTEMAKIQGINFGKTRSVAGEVTRVSQDYTASISEFDLTGQCKQGHYFRNQTSLLY